MEERTKQLLNRTFYFGVNTLKFLKKLPDDYIDRIPKVQVGRASTSIGANYEEAQAAVSKRDFVNKIGTCNKEARESVYWLRILKELHEDKKFKDEFPKFVNEAEELRNIFAAIKKTSGNK
jgi:four helix bundle protein